MLMSEGWPAGAEGHPVSSWRVDGTFSVGSFLFLLLFLLFVGFFVFFFKEQLLFDALRMLGERVVEEANFWLKPKKFGSEKDGLFFS